MNIFLLMIISVSLVNGNLTSVVNKVVDFLIKEVDRENIANILRNFTLKPHFGGTQAEWDTANLLENEWKKQGLDVHSVPYDVLLSYQDMDNPNYARVHDASGTIVWQSQGRSPHLKGEQFYSEVPPDFSAFSAPGNVSGEVVYVNFGKEEDFDKLTNLGVDIKGKIVIARYGEIFRGNKVHLAQERGAIAVILYSDPQQYARDGLNNVFPDTVYMPGDAVAIGTTTVEDGDPLTPFYPATDSAFRLPEEEANLPKIPVIPLGYNDVTEILKRMQGDIVPPDWQGGLNLDYKIGPGLSNSFYLSLEVNTHNKRTTTFNIIGVIKGAIEPDRYVLMGNHRDAWNYGALDPSSGTAAMLELTRTLMEYKRQTGWRPRRSLVFCSWGAEEYGVIGSFEYAEEFAKQLSDKAVAYINIDMAMEGNYTLRTKSVPLLYNAIKDAAKLIPNPDPKEVTQGRNTVYDTWVHRTPDIERPTEPHIRGIGAGSDYRGLQHCIGVPSIDFRYTFSKEMYADPSYHTAYQTYYIVSQMYDIGFHFHASIAQLWGVLGVYLADAEILPFSLDEYSNFIIDAQTNIKNTYETILTSRNISLDYFLAAGENFKNVTEKFPSIIAQTNMTDPLAVRRINDQIMMVERAFIDPRGLPGRPHMNHVVVAASSTDSHVSSAFAGLTDALNEFDTLSPQNQNKQIRIFQEHLAACTHFINTAAKVLSDDLW